MSKHAHMIITGSGREKNNTISVSSHNCYLIYSKPIKQKKTRNADANITNLHAVKIPYVMVTLFASSNVTRMPGLVIR